MPQIGISQFPRRKAGANFYPTTPCIEYSGVADLPFANYGVFATETGVSADGLRPTVRPADGTGTVRGVLRDMALDMECDSSGEELKAGETASIGNLGFFVVPADDLGATLVRGDAVYYRTTDDVGNNEFKGALTDATGTAYANAIVWHPAVDGLAVLKLNG